MPPLPHTSSWCGDILSTVKTLSHNHHVLEEHNHSVMDFAILWLNQLGVMSRLLGAGAVSPLSHMSSWRGDKLSAVTTLLNNIHILEENNNSMMTMPFCVA
jgi:hypothetical protein